MPATTRQATTADIPLLVELMREFHAEADYALDSGLAASSFATLLGDPSLGAIWIVFDDAVAAGYVVLTVRFSMEYFGLDAFIDDLFVRPEHRRRGFGRLVLESVLDECRRRRALALHVIVGAHNVAAKTLYGSIGLQAHQDGREMLSVRLTDA